jgi:WhiB family transcriptional regulator, redox-sensing transcriptional regulator
MDTSADTKWMAKGLCADKPPALFFPSDGVGVELAKRICEECPVRSECLEFALENRIDHGVWGGTSERQRRRIVKARASEGSRQRMARRSGDRTSAAEQPVRIEALSSH